MITLNYISGIQHTLRQTGLVNYASDEHAAGDAEQLAGAVDEQVPVDQGALAQEGAPPQATHIIAQALSEMAQHASEDAQVASAKADVVQNAVAAIAQSGAMKTASAPGDNNVVAGHRPGSVAAGERSARGTDHDEELSNAVPNTAHRPSVFNPTPGKTGVRGGTIGAEKGHPGAEGRPAMKADHNKELTNAVPNTAKRPNVHGGPGNTSVKGGTIGAEKKASLSDYLSRI